MPRGRKRLLVALAILVIGIQLVPAGRTNPPSRADLRADAEVSGLLRRSCYDCHSGETRWPWYAHVAPVSWLIVHDVSEARSYVNFSEWSSYDRARQAELAARCSDEAAAGRMPPGQYLLMHAGAKPTPESARVLQAWAQSLRAE
jgi:hypothetical protein